MKKNVASQKIGCQMITASDGSAFTGSVTVAVTGDAGTQATGSVGSGACTHEGNGYHTYAPAQAETNYDLVAFTFTGTGAIPTTIQIFTSFPQTGDNYARLGAPAGASVSADVAAMKVDTAAILVDTGTTLDGKIDTIDTNVDSILVDTGTTLDALINNIETDVDAIISLLDDARTEPGQGAPPANPDLVTKIDYLYKAWRNKKDNDGAETKLYADDGSTVDHKQTTVSSGGTVTKGEWITGA